MALQNISQHRLAKYTHARTVHVFTDSLESVQVLDGSRKPRASTPQSLITQIVSTATDLSQHGLRIQLHWIPGHIQHKFHDAAHAKAVETRQVSALTAAQLRPAPEKSHCFATPLAALTQVIRHRIKHLWQRRWDRPDAPGRLLYDVQPQVGLRARHKWSGKRFFQVLRCRLRHGKCALNSCTDDSDSYSCPHCDNDETVAHFLWACNHYTDARQELLLHLEGNGFRANNYADLLNTRHTEELDKFLEKTKRFEDLSPG